MPEQRPGVARRIPGQGFAGDRGAPDPALASALSAYAASPGAPARHLGVFVALQTTRVLVPVVALLGEDEVDEGGLARD
jgi:hypothetical protein